MDTRDEQRFTELYRQHYAAVDAYVRRRIHAAQVTDVVADVFLVAWRRFGELPEKAPLPWLYGVARRTLANTYRSENQRLRLSETLVSQPRRQVDDHADTVIQKVGLAAAFDNLGDADQEVLRLSLWEELPPPDAAHALGCSVPTYQVRLHRARKRLKTGLSVALANDEVLQGNGATQVVSRTWGGADA
ncbi:RNA polymerase subunit sigma [Streptomyces sp. WAC 01325]|uniref:RNA polymerase sigma factor n=1 Tax=Streptomyces sp. WAC 01325 TaxID=2203202 RepID=UPI000F85FB2F|nr:sigma-70 family RNA polymerase sigma factor [Streptomyces sp. WAC 01325]RSN04696.1 RNA polymerase subunit sigma [Streptomyces sp. WAC 01325]